MFHLGAFQYTAANTGAGVFVNVTAIQDAFLSISPNNRFFLPRHPQRGDINWTVALGYAMGATMTVARINCPSLRNISLPSIYPTMASLTVPSLAQVSDLLEDGPKLPTNEEVGVEADSAAAELHSAGLWFHDGVWNATQGPIITCGFTATCAAAAAGAWASGNITLTQNLPVGKYEVVGMQVRGDDLIFARLIYPFGGPRPGCIGQPGAAAANQLAILPNNIFRKGRLGSWGVFDSRSQPQLEVFGGAATTAQAGVLDLVRVG